MNKENLMRSEFGSNMKECVTAWDRWLTELRILGTGNNTQDYRRVRDAATWCQAQWEVYQMALKHFCRIEYHFTRTDHYFGIVNKDETDWLLKVERCNKAEG